MDAPLAQSIGKASRTWVRDYSRRAFHRNQKHTKTKGSWNHLPGPSSIKAEVVTVTPDQAYPLLECWSIEVIKKIKNSKLKIESASGWVALSWRQLLIEFTMISWFSFKYFFSFWSFATNLSVSSWHFSCFEAEDIDHESLLLEQFIWIYSP